MSTFAQVVREYELRCEENQVPEETVLAFLVELANQERYQLYLHYEEEMPEELEEKFRGGMERILNQEPMSHVLGYSWFYGYQMIVSEDVLIPRPETEELCAHILSRIDAYFPEGMLSCADIGTGSGAIAITLTKEEPRVQMIGTDISKEAIEVAKENAIRNEANVTWMVGSYLDPLIEQGILLDVLVCNPPYIPSGETMETSVVDFEPHVALFGGKDGLDGYRAVFQDCKKVLKEKAMMAFEMGWNQKSTLEQFVQTSFPECSYEFLKDMNGKDRMLFVYFGIEKDIM